MAAAPLLLAAFVLNAGVRQPQGASQLLEDGTSSAAPAPLAFGADGSISADTIRSWHKAVEDDGAFPYPDNSFFDATNSDVWDVGSTEGKETSWLKPGRWVAARRGGGSEQRDHFASDAHSEYQDGRWWPYELGVGPSAEAKRVKEAEDHKHGAPSSWNDLYMAMQRRYNNPTGDPYMEQEYERLVVGPAKAVMKAHGAGLPSPPAAAGLAGQVETAQDAVQRLDREAGLALPALDKLFGDIGTLNKGRGLPGSAAWPEKWPADGGITHGVFRKSNPRANGGRAGAELQSWEEVAAANVDSSMPLTLPGDGFEPKESKTRYDWPYASPQSPLGFFGAGGDSQDSHAFDRNFVQDPSNNFIAEWTSGGT